MHIHIHIFDTYFSHGSYPRKSADFGFFACLCMVVYFLIRLSTPINDRHPSIVLLPAGLLNEIAWNWNVSKINKPNYFMFTDIHCYKVIISFNVPIVPV